jgi:uncharacterized protein (TIGR01777 family)
VQRAPLFRHSIIHDFKHSMATPNRLKILVSGASGMLGRAVVAHFSKPSALNHFQPMVYKLVRSEPTSSNEIFWDPKQMRIDLEKCEDFDAVIHLAGENIGSGDGPLAFTGRWTDKKKHDIFESRRRGTLLIAQALASVRRKPRVFLSASGSGFYGSQGDSILTESSEKGKGFLAEVAQMWEESTAGAKAAGIRTVNMRFGVMLSKSGGVIGALSSCHGWHCRVVASCFCCS